MRYSSSVSTPLGLWTITASEDGITGVCRCEAGASGPENEWTRQAARELQAYFAGTATAFTVPLLPRGTAFQQTVWETLRQIPYGQSRSYGQVAAAMGRPTAVRAVAQAIGRNPCLVLIPCHRVLGKDGSLTGFSAGLAPKRALLDLEEIAYEEGLERKK